LSSATNLKEALQQSLNAAIKTSGAESGVIYLLDEITGDYKSIHYMNVSAATMEMFSVLRAGSQDTDLISKGLPIYVSADEFTPRYEKQFKSEGWIFTATLPVMHEGKAVACFIICSTNQPNLPVVIRNSLEAIAADVGAAIERISSRNALRESEEQYRNVVEVTYDAIAIAQDGKLKFFNGRVVELTGYNPDELNGMPFIELVFPEDRNLVMDRYTSRLAGEEEEREYSFRYVRKDGNVGWAEINTVLIEWKGKTASLVSLRDITDRKKAEDSLRESEERYRKLTESTADMIATVDMDLVLTYVNNSVQQTLGYDPQEVIGLPLSHVVSPTSYANLVSVFKDDLDKVLPPGSISETREIQFIKKDGSTLWTEGKMRWLRDANQNPNGVIAVIRDNTERRLAAEALRSPM
jgi:PAS domain S-box-containing protein